MSSTGKYMHFLSLQPGNIGWAFPLVSSAAIGKISYTDRIILFLNSYVAVAVV
jgi:hypothetical protein